MNGVLIILAESQMAREFWGGAGYAAKLSALPHTPCVLALARVTTRAYSSLRLAIGCADTPPHVLIWASRSRMK